MIRLRKLMQKDAVLMLEWMHDPDIQQQFQKNMMSMSLADAENFCSSEIPDEPISEGQNIHYAIVNDEDEYLGTISLKNISMENRSAEYAISTRRCAHGTGIAKEATTLILEKGFNDLELHRIYLNVLADNERAIRFYEKCGFTYEGEFRDHLIINGQTKSLKWYGMLRNEFFCDLAN